MKNVAIIGAGQLGSRHLQALAKVNDEMTLYIVDPLQQSLKISRERFNEVNTFSKELVCLNRILELPRELEFVVISTNSKQRLGAIKELVKHSQVKYLLLEKFLFPTALEYEEANRIFGKFNTQVYVNCARLMWPSYQKLKTVLDTSSKVSLKVSGVNWNLASNSIHFLNLFLYLTNESSAYVDTSMLDEKLLNNKRVGYIELSGTLRAITTNNHELILTSKIEGDGSLTILSTSSSQSIEIREAEEFISINGDEKKFKVYHQSSLTKSVYEKLQETGDCSLVPYKQSAQEHLILLRAFNDFLGDRGGAIT